MKKKYIFVLVVLLCHSTVYAQWTWLNPKPSGQTGRDIYFLNDQKGFIINNGEILSTENGGDSWSVLLNITSANRIRFKNSTGYIIGNFGVLYKSIDSGSTWTRINVGTDDNLTGISLIEEDEIYITSNKSLFVSQNGGNSFEIFEIPDVKVIDSYFTSSSTGHAACTNGTILKTITGGDSWYITESSNVIPSDFFRITFISENIGYASQEHANILKTTDGGETWQKIARLDAIYSIHFINEQIGYVAGDDGAIHKTIDGGKNWEWKGFDSRIWGNDLYSIFFVNENVGFATGLRGRIIKTEDGGLNWSPYALTYNNISHVYSVNNVIIATGENIYKSEDKGSNWTTIKPFSESVYINQAHFFSELEAIIIVGSYYYSSLHKTKDGGKSWKIINVADYDVKVSSIYFLNNNIGFLTSSGGGLYKTTDGGEIWSLISSRHGFSKIHFLNNDNGIGIANGDLYKTTDGGVNWQMIYEVYGSFTDISFVNDKAGYISAEHSTILKTIDGANTWEEIKTEYDHFQSVSFKNENIGYITGEYGMNLKTSNGGYTWEKVNVPSGVSKIVFSANKDVYAYGSNGKILKGIATFDEISLTALEVNQFDVSSALLEGVVSSNGETVNSIQLEYGSGNKFDKMLNLNPGTVQPNTHKNYNLTVRELLPDTEYNFRIKVTYNNQVQTSNVITFKTLPEYSVRMSDVYTWKPHDIQLGGYIISNRFEISNIKFEYDTLETSFRKTIHADPHVIGANDQSHVAAMLYELKESTKYFVRLKFTHQGKEYTSDPTSFKTSPEYKIVVKKPLISENKVDLNAFITSYEKAITDLSFEYGLNQKYDSEVITSPFGINGYSSNWVTASINVPHQDSTYFYRLKGRHNSKIIYSDINFFKLSGGLLLMTDQTNNVTQTTARLSGLFASQGDYVHEINIEYGLTTEYGQVAILEQYEYSNATIRVNAQVNDLNPGTEYHYRIKAKVNDKEFFGQDKVFKTSVITTINEVNIENLKYYPNPTNDYVYFESEYNIELIEVLSVYGNSLIKSAPYSKHYSLNLSSFAPGIYIVQVINEGKTSIQKIIKE